MSPRSPGAEVRLIKEIRLDQGFANVVDCYWSNGIQREDRRRSHRLGLSLSPVPRNFAGRYMMPGCKAEALGRLIFIPSGVALEASNAGGHARLAGIHFKDEQWRRVSGRTTAATAHQLERGMSLRSAEIVRALKRIGKELLSPGFASTTVIESLMAIVMIDLDRQLLGGKSTRSTAFRNGIPREALALMEERIRAVDERIPTAGELSHLTGISSRHLLRSYQLETGETIRERLQRESSVRARHFLRSTDMPIKAISWNLGFSSQGNFTQAFSRMHGETPSRYRSRFR